jgi:hypothetical protein
VEAAPGAGRGSDSYIGAACAARTKGKSAMAKRWYSVSVLSNFEKRIAEQIRTAVAEKGLQDEIEEVLVPEEEVIEIRRGKKVTVPRRFMPGFTTALQWY